MLNQQLNIKTDVKPAIKTDVKPDVKPAVKTDVKPTEVKPTEVKPEEFKPAEFKPEEFKPTEFKAEEYKEDYKKKEDTINDILKKYYNILSKNIDNKKINCIILIFFSVASYFYFEHKDTLEFADYRKKLIIENEEFLKILKEKEEREKKAFALTENEQKIQNILDKFNLIAEKILYIGNVLYKSLNDNFNKILKISNIDYKYILSILNYIGNIKDTNSLLKALDDLNTLCKNIIIISSKQTLLFLNNFSKDIRNFAILTSGKLGELAIDNLNKCLLLLSLPNVDKEKLFVLIKNYYEYLPFEFILSQMIYLYDEIKKSLLNTSKTKKSNIIQEDINNFIEKIDFENTNIVDLILKIREHPIEKQKIIIKNIMNEIDKFPYKKKQEFLDIINLNLQQIKKLKLTSLNDTLTVNTILNDIIEKINSSDYKSDKLSSNYYDLINKQLFHHLKSFQIIQNEFEY